MSGRPKATAFLRDAATYERLRDLSAEELEVAWHLRNEAGGYGPIDGTPFGYVAKSVYLCIYGAEGERMIGAGAPGEEQHG